MSIYERGKDAGVRGLCQWLTENALESPEENLRRLVPVLAIGPTQPKTPQ